MITGEELNKILSWPLRFDLHTHTNVSDGIYTPEELVSYAAKRKVDVLAITDHDNIGAIVKARAAAVAENVHLVAGIEISTLWHSNEIHVVGLCIDTNCPELIALVEQQKELRDERARAIAAKLEKCGFTDVYARTQAMAGEGASLTRANFALFLKSENVAVSVDKCFDLYLSKGSRAYVTSKWGGIGAAVAAIKKAGGIPVLAHPRRYDMNNKWLRRLLTDFKEAGGEGMEVAGSMQQPAEREFLADLSLEYGFFASCGSDFHRSKNYMDLGSNLVLPERTIPVWRSPNFKLEA